MEKALDVGSIGVYLRSSAVTSILIFLKCALMDDVAAVHHERVADHVGSKRSPDAAAGEIRDFGYSNNFGPGFRFASSRLPATAYLK